MRPLTTLISIVGLAWCGVSRDPKDTPLARRTFLTALAPRRSPTAVAFFDADETLRTSRAHPGTGFIDGPGDIALRPGVVDRLREVKFAGYLVVIVSNQGGVPKYHSIIEADHLLRLTAERLAQSGAAVDYYDFAENYDHNRKPGTGMFDRLENKIRKRLGEGARIDRARTFVVGDAGWTPDEVRPDGTRGQDHANSDRVFAERLNLRFFYAADFFAKPFEVGTVLAH